MRVDLPEVRISDYPQLMMIEAISLLQLVDRKILMSSFLIHPSSYGLKTEELFH